MMGYELLDFRVIGDDRGSLIALEGNHDIPFDIKRVYYIFGTEKSVIRGQHAHKKLKQVIFCLSGSCDFILDSGVKREVVSLNRPNIGLYIKNNLWREFTNFSKDCVVMVLASEHYDENDYIRDYNEFISGAQNDKSA